MSSDHVPSSATTPAPAAPGVIDASCRLPVLVLFASASVWLVVSALLSFLASLKFHKASLLADCPWLTYGHVQAGAFNTFVYGFAVQAAVGVMLWLIARLGRTPLSQGGFAAVGAVFWNLGVTLGLVGILLGDGSGYEWFEFPRYAAPVLLAGYSLLAVSAGLTFASRREETLYPSMWFLLAAIFWFPWIYATALVLVHWFPARGVMQAVVHQWYAHNLQVIWFGSIGIAAVLYFVPKLSGRPLASRVCAMLTFWSLLLFGGLGGMHHGMPVPAWLPALSTVMAVLLAAPVLLLALNLHDTMKGDFGAACGHSVLKFVLAGAAALVAAVLMKALGSVPQISDITHFTYFTVAHGRLLMLGFAGLVLLGSLYFITPRVAGVAWPVAALPAVHFATAVAGVLLIVLPLALGGVHQGLKLYDQAAWAEVSKLSLRIYRITTLGDLLWLVGSLALLVNVKLLLFHLARPWVLGMVTDSKAPKSREVVA